jgi:hypothetical protein
MRIVTLALMAALCLSCASAPQPSVITSIPQTIKEACDFYTKVKPQVVAYVQWAAANWSKIPDDQKVLLLDLKAALPKLDSVGVNVCAISDALSAIEEGKKIRTPAGVDWDAVLSTVLKVAATAAQLKAQGAF